MRIDTTRRDLAAILGAVTALLLTLTACGDDGTMTNDAGTDGGTDGALDGGDGSVDGGADAGPDADTDGGTLPTRCLAPDGADASGTDTFVSDGATATVTIGDRDACARTYTMTSDAALRDDEPENPRTIAEQDGWPTTRTGHDLFDALHALALEEVRENSVASIRDWAFDDGEALDCGPDGCFETGRLWHYVWTRDTAYAVDLGLAPLDAARARSSLEFKLSERRGGGDLQIVQDTGTGGSYPVSSDRVAWALGAEAVLHQLEGAEREAFAARAFEALRNTIEHDRRVVYDETDGLYRGEQSFLDWREQTYPDWTEGDVVHIGMSKALGTNLLHLRALTLATTLADEADDTTRRDRYLAWADALREAIRTRFWLEDEGLFSTYITTALDPAPVRRFDLLASSFAVLFDVATPAQAARILERYPHYGPGAPVVWPQQQNTPIYHNRGEWPFVTAYWLRAAKHAGNAAVAERMVVALIRGAALNLSNMENFEAGSGDVWVDEGVDSGPVVNSQRQLWSVAGYLSMVHHTLFGLEPRGDGLVVSPFVTADMRASLFAGTDTLVLNDYPYRGRTLSVLLNLPAADAAGTGPLSVSAVTLNGAPITDGLLPAAMLADENRVEVTLVAGSGSDGTLTEVSDAEYQNVFGPRTPGITGVSAVAGGVRLSLTRGAETAGDVTFRIYRDGVVVADALPGSTSGWTDDGVDPDGARSPCWVVETTFLSSGNHSQHSPPFCWWGPGAAHITTIGAGAMTAVGGSPTSNHGRFHYESWGDPGDTLTAPSFTPSQSGDHWLQLTFGNGAGAMSTGITCAVKRIVVEEVAGGAIVAEGPALMPHLGEWSRWEDSSFVRAELVAGREYRIVIRGDEEVVNMSAFEHFERYTAGNGGRSGAYNRANIAELKILAR